jgi:hypothetical protein
MLEYGGKTVHLQKVGDYGALYGGKLRDVSYQE